MATKPLTPAVIDRMSQTAAELADLLDQQKLIEDAIKPLKDELVAYARNANLAETLDLGTIKIIPSDKKKETIDVHLVTPDWLFRFRQAGGRFDFKPKLDKADGSHFDELLREIGLEVEINTIYTLKRSPR